LAVGASGERVRLLRARLGLTGSGTSFDAPLAAAVRRFEAVHGLPADGIADAATIAALNRGASHYERLIRANLDRARALPGGSGGRFVLVDTAGARLWLFEDGQVRDTMRVIVGKPGMATPEMAGLIRFATLNPYWNLPPDLGRVRAREVLRRGLDVLKRERLQAVAGPEENAPVVNGAGVNWAAVASGRSSVRLRQLPGPGNMMGGVKFMLPNRLGIYLHDTPDKAAFARGDRRISSGCVRVEDARRLARWLFRGGEPHASGAPEQRVDLPEPVPVYITYLTAVPGPGGILFQPDVYRRDAALLARLS
jgi:murein L,D-transpeptidase YcbB/YkuD